MSSRCRLHGEELHRLQSWNFALTSLGSHCLHASSAERLPLNVFRWTSNNSSYSSVFTPLLFRQNLQKRNDSTPTFGGYCKAPPQPTRYWYLVTSTPELVETLKPGKSPCETWRWKPWRQRAPTARVLLWAITHHYKHNLPAKRKFENNLDASPV